MPRLSHIVNNEYSLLPAGVLFSHIFCTGYLSVVVGRTILRSYLALPPSSATRHRQRLRSAHVQTFSFLVLASLTVAGFFGVTFSSLSYRVWAAERGVELPDRCAILDDFRDFLFKSSYNC